MGQETDAFFVIVAGRAELWQIDDEEGIPMKAAELERGATFGEEGLLTGKISPVTVRMLEDGVLLQLASDAFARLLAKPLVREVDAPVAKAMIENHYVALDVRLEEEFDEGHIPGAAAHSPVAIAQAGRRTRQRRPLCRLLSQRSAQFGGRFQLSQRGYEVVSMVGGILAWSDPLTEPLD